MKKFRILLASALITLQVVGVSAQDKMQDSDESSKNNLSVFRSIYNPEIPDLKKPTVLRVRFNKKQNYNIAILEDGSDIPQGFKKTRYFVEPVKVLNSSPVIGDLSHLIDGDSNTFLEFDLDQDGGNAFVELEASEPFTTSSMRLHLQFKTMNPTKAAIKAWVNEDWKTVLAYEEKESAGQSFFEFPEHTAKKWRIEFEHSQPLRLWGITLNEKKQKELLNTEYRWLARPGKGYQIYADAAVDPKLDLAEVGNLVDETDVIDVALGEPTANAEFIEPDTDKDGIIDAKDNCIKVANSNQSDVDSNGIGDACEDFDSDGIYNAKDNCIEHANRSQKDSDADGIGDACDEEESRLTENLPWLPWATMIIAFSLLLWMVYSTWKVRKKEKSHL